MKGSARKPARTRKVTRSNPPGNPGVAQPGPPGRGIISNGAFPENQIQIKETHYEEDVIQVPPGYHRDCTRWVRDNSREAAKETARAAGKLAVTAAGDAASTVVDVAVEGAKGTGEVIAEQASGAKDALVDAVKAEVKSAKKNIEKAADSAVETAKKEVK